MELSNNSNSEETCRQIKLMASNGLTPSEVESFLGRLMTPDEQTIYNQAKALEKLRKAKERNQKKAEKKNSILKQPTTKKLEVVHVGQKNPQQLPPLSKRYTKAQIEDVIVRAHGLTSSICAALDCTTQQFYVYLRNKPDMKQLQEDSRMDLVHKAEEVMMCHLQSDDPQIRQRAAEYILNRLGRTTGWGEDRLFGITVNAQDMNRQITAIFGIENNT